jgi:lipopolysaccharide transport system ATP-binding protein
MSRPTAVFDGVWKKFRSGERHDTLRDVLPALVRRAVRRGRTTELDTREFWALKDVSFEAQPGEAFGIIGPNGAGKSTILKLLTKILKPTRGTCQVRGRIGALIEVAAGFHPDLTGRENIYLQGAIMGMRPAEVRRQFDAIVDFAGVRDFVDTPVKRYSSGMNARLGFSIASHLEPQALIVDEVLSVGDMSFQERCVQRMIEFKRNGVAIIFVSHNLQAIARLCERCMYLRGSPVVLGSPAEAIERYVKDKPSRPPGVTPGISIVSATLVCPGADGTCVAPGQRLMLRVVFEVEESLRDLTFGFTVHRSTDQLLVFNANVAAADLGVREVKAGDRHELDFGFTVHLSRGHYQLGCYVYHSPTHAFVAMLEAAASISVQETITHSGIAYLDLQPAIRLVNADEQLVAP